MSRHVVVVRIPLTDAEWDEARRAAQRERATTRQWLSGWTADTVRQMLHRRLGGT
jgi:hypothetical protein